MITGKATHLIRNHKYWAAIAIALMVFGACKATELLAPAKEIALIVGEPWKDMQARSSAEIGPVFEGRNWYRQPTELSRLRFADPAHAFITPPAKFFTVGFDDKGLVDGVRMSPQVEPLPLNDVLRIALDIQNQWRKSGWVLEEPIEFPAYEDTPEWRRKIEQCTANSTHWQVKDKYNALLVISCFRDEQEANKDSYLVTLAIGPYIDYQSDAPVKPK